VDPKPVAGSQALLAHLMGPTDANGTGNIHGGTIMKLTDEAAALAAVKHARTRVVTVGIDRMTFLVPIYVGALVTFKACVNAAWTSSMEVGVRVEAENVLDGTIEHTSTASRSAPTAARPRWRRPSRILPTSCGGCVRRSCGGPTAYASDRR